MTHVRSPLRALRAALFAAVCVTLAAVGHSSLSVHPLPPLALLAAFAGTAVAAWAAAGRRRGTGAVAGAMVVLQGVLHLGFSLTGAHAPATADPATAALPPAAPGPHPAGHVTGHTAPDPAHLHHGTGGTAAGGDGAADLTADLAALLGSTAGHGGAGMLTVHLLAALLCGLWLARGEAALFALARAALAHAFTPLRLLQALASYPAPGDPRRPVRRPRRNARRPHTLVLDHTLSRRGPPRPSSPRATALATT